MCVYLAVMSLNPTGTGRKRWIARWKAAAAGVAKRGGRVVLGITRPPVRVSRG